MRTGAIDARAFRKVGLGADSLNDLQMVCDSILQGSMALQDDGGLSLTHKSAA